MLCSAMVYVVKDKYSETVQYMQNTLARVFDENNICMVHKLSWRQYML